MGALLRPLTQVEGRTYLRVGTPQEAAKYGLWPWEDIQSILGGENCADGECGYVKKCATCKVKADTRAYVPQTRSQAGQVYAGVRRMIQLKD